jgi:hypothetical protein
VIETDEMAVAQRDMALATLVAVLGVGALFVVLFRGLVRPALATLTLVVGCAWSLGLTTLTIGHLNILTIVFMPMLVGLGDHSIHFIARFREEQDRAGERPPLAPSAAKAITLASLTNIVGFGSLMLSSHRGIWSLGVVVAVGVGCLWVASMTTLPGLLSLLARRQPIERLAGPAVARGDRPALLGTRSARGAVRTYDSAVPLGSGAEGGRP